MDRLATEEIAELLRELTACQRDVVLLRLVGGLTVEEVAHVIGKRPGAVRAVQHRAVEVLRQAAARNAIAALDGS